tara:strand:- start:850 stop:1908 length:1059 start_codon:yes stop_codon:yes gene_type:complete
MERYARQLSLPEMSLDKQERLSKTSILMVGAGGLGSPVLPVLAGAGVGHIVIADHDTVDETNLHRQTIYKQDQTRQSKAKLAKTYLEHLNSDIQVEAINEKLGAENHQKLLNSYQFDLILDGSDNFKTKDLLNSYSIKSKSPLLSASVLRFGGQIGLFAGYLSNQPCYRCLFPDFPENAYDCNQAGVLGSASGVIGMLQAHIALCTLLDLGDYKIGDIVIAHLDKLRLENIHLPKNKSCATCKNQDHEEMSNLESRSVMIDILSIEDVAKKDAIIVDVREPHEISSDPLNHDLIKRPPLQIPLTQIPMKMSQLPTHKPLAFICAGNIRSQNAAEYVAARGYEDVCVLDKFSL